MSELKVGDKVIIDKVRYSDQQACKSFSTEKEYVVTYVGEWHFTINVDDEISADIFLSNKSNQWRKVEV